VSSGAQVSACNQIGTGEDPDGTPGADSGEERNSAEDRQMMVIDFTPELYLFGWTLLLLLLVAGVGIIAGRSREDRTAQTWVETRDFVRSLQAADGRRRGIGRHARRSSTRRASVDTGARSAAARGALLALAGSALIASAGGVAHGTSTGRPRPTPVTQSSHTA
jgi:hypothetical protein